MYRSHPWVIRWREASKNLKLKIVALYFAAQEIETPWQAKAIALAVVAYGLSPIDLIPDFIPVLGYLDDLIVIPFGIWLAIRLVPTQIMAEAFRKAAAIPHINRKLGLFGAAAIAIIYALLVWWVLRYFLAVPQ